MSDRDASEKSDVQCEFYTPREVAKVLNLSTDLVYGLLREGTMPAIKLGNGKRMIWRIPKAGFVDYIGQHSVGRKIPASDD